MNVDLKIALLTLAKLAAPVVTLFYRKGIWVTPDDPVSPFGMYEEKMRRMYAHFPKWVADWWWLGVRNRAYGLAYKFKPQYFKDLTSYDDIQVLQLVEETRFGKRRVIFVGQYKEVTWSFGKGKFGFHVIAGYRLRPIYDQWYNNRFNAAGIPYRPINMDARPILSIRTGTSDD